MGGERKEGRDVVRGREGRGVWGEEKEEEREKERGGGGRGGKEDERKKKGEREN